VPRQDLGGARPVEMPGSQFLALRRVEKRQIGLSQLARAAPVHDLVDDRDRRFGEDARVNAKSYDRRLAPAARLGSGL
jgi:hypothetical protein